MSEPTQPADSTRTLFELQRLRAEVDELTILLDDSGTIIRSLFKLLRDHNIPVGSPELIKAREKVEAEMQTLRTANAGLVEKLRDRERERDHANDTADAVLAEAALLRAKLQVLEAARMLEAARTQAAANSLANMLSYEELEEKVSKLERQNTLMRGVIRRLRGLDDADPVCDDIGFVKG